MTGSTLLLAALERVRARIRSAALQADRDPESIELVAVTKQVDPPVARALYEAGVTALGENRDSALLAKVEAFGDVPVHWHFLGHLQRNKVRRVLPHLSVLHSLDSKRLVDVLAEVGPPPGFQAFIQLHLSADDAKTGVTPDEAPALLEHARARGIQVAGLMSMGVHADAERTARIFASTAALAREWEAEGRFPNRPRLSMGMSGDLELAIQHGADVVRVGSDLVQHLKEGAGQ